MRIAILTLQGFNELDSFIALGILSRVKKANWHITICSNEATITSMNGVTVVSQSDFSELSKADAVIVGSGINTRTIAMDETIMAELRLNPQNQVIGSQCSGALILAKLGLLSSLPACTGLTTKPWLEELGTSVLNQSFFASNNIASSGGCMSSVYLSAWTIAKLTNEECARGALHYVAPVGEKVDFVEKAMSIIKPYI